MNSTGHGGYKQVHSTTQGSGAHGRSEHYSSSDGLFAHSATLRRRHR